MLRWLERAMPHAGVDADNPLFKYELRRLRWGKTAGQLVRFSVKTLGRVCKLTTRER